jgi:hypothetical protein
MITTVSYIFIRDYCQLWLQPKNSLKKPQWRQGLRATHGGALDPLTQGGLLGPQIPPPFLLLDSHHPHSHPIRTKLKITLPILRNMILGKGGWGVLQNILWDLPSPWQAYIHTNSQLCDPTQEVGTLSLYYVYYFSNRLNSVACYLMQSK